VLIQINQRLPPFFAQMMGFVKAEQRYLGIGKQSDNLVGLVFPESVRRTDAVSVLVILFFVCFLQQVVVIGGATECRQECLIGNNRDILGFTDVCRDKSVVLLFEKGRADAVTPLMLDGIGGTEDECRTAKPPDYLNAKRRLSCPWCCYHMQFVVAEMCIEAVQNPCLIASPTSIEIQDSRLCHIRCFRFSVWSFFVGHHHHILSTSTDTPTLKDVPVVSGEQ
jgi:hypothetical protein